VHFNLAREKQRNTVEPLLSGHPYLATSYQSRNDGFSIVFTSIKRPGAHFSKAPETFRVRKAIFSPSVSKNGEVFTPETYCMEVTSLHIKNIWIKQLRNRKIRDFAMVARAREVSGAFEKRAPAAFKRQLSISPRVAV